MPNCVFFFLDEGFFLMPGFIGGKAYLLAEGGKVEQVLPGGHELADMYKSLIDGLGGD